jgi:radical SAM superfamily enzyme with C-terminal helix-hairpin-helix motif
MNKINSTHEEVGNPDKDEIIVIMVGTGVPGNYKNSESDHYTEYLDHRMEEEVIVVGKKIRAYRDSNTEKTSLRETQLRVTGDTSLSHNKPPNSFW